MTDFDPFAAAVFIGGQFRRAGADAAAIEAVNPSTLEVVGRIADCRASDAAAAAAACAAAQAEWRKTDAKTRAAALHRVADAIESSPLDDVARLMTMEMGKPYPEAVGELRNVAPIYRYCAEMARDDAGRVAGSTQAGSFQHMRMEPRGVSVHIVPFNYPILLMSWTVAASLAAGNACVVKPAPATTLCTLRFMERFRALPPGLVNCATGGARTARLLIESPQTHMVAFTGGASAAREVGTACAQKMKPCLIESGGNDALIVAADAPMDVAVAGAVTAAFHLSGQICTSAERVFVEDAVHDEFLGKFAAATATLRVGDGFEKSEIGPLVSEAARDKVVRIVEDARARGARLICGGRTPPHLPRGWFYEPTILADAAPDMMIMREEAFGPVAAVCRCADLDEAIRLANQSDYGLGASIFTGKLESAMRAAEECEAGMVWVNNPLIDNDALPFGGWKRSGIGCALGRQGLDAFRRPKMVVIDHSPKAQDWWYPYQDDVFFRPGEG